MPRNNNSPQSILHLFASFDIFGDVGCQFLSLRQPFFISPTGMKLHTSEDDPATVQMESENRYLDFAASACATEYALLRLPLILGSPIRFQLDVRDPLPDAAIRERPEVLHPPDERGDILETSPLLCVQ